MKKAVIFLFVLLFFAFPLNKSFAQTEGNIFHVHTLKFTMPEGGSWAEFDSLTALMTKNVTSKQEKIVSQRILTHLWGSNSKQLIVITEYKKIEDLVGEDETDKTLFAASWKTDEDQKVFNKAYNKYWTMEHSDEIYREILNGRK